jgi:methionyl-tRNA formyltransferase
VQRAIQNGDLETGITVFKLDEGMDTGAVLAELPVQIQPEETAGELLTRLNQLGISLLNQELPKLYNDSFVLTTQSGEVSLASKPTREDAKISFTNKAETIVNQVRAFNPEPVAWCLYKGEPFRILRARVFKGPNDGAIGSYSLVNGKVVVKCSDFGIELIEVQPSSKKVMSAIDWYRGAESQGSFE